MDQNNFFTHFTTNREMTNGHAQYIQQIQHALHNCRCNSKFIISYTMTWWEMEMPRQYFYRNACWNANTQKWVYLFFIRFTLRLCIKMYVCVRAFVRIVCTDSYYKFGHCTHVQQVVEFGFIVVVVPIHMQWKKIVNEPLLKAQQIFWSKNNNL